MKSLYGEYHRALCYSTIHHVRIMVQLTLHFIEWTALHRIASLASIFNRK